MLKRGRFFMGISERTLGKSTKRGRSENHFASKMMVQASSFEHNEKNKPLRLKKITFAIA